MKRCKFDYSNWVFRLRLFSWVIVLVFLVSLGITQAGIDQVRFDRGLELYLAQGCGVCHTLSKASTKGVFGPSHDGLAVIAPARFLSPDYHGEATSPEKYVFESIVKPNAYTVPGYALTRFHMPAYIQLNWEDLDALVYMLLQP